MESAEATGQGMTANTNTVTRSRGNTRTSSRRTGTVDAASSGTPTTSNGSGAGSPADGPKTFEFVFVTDSESRRQVRRHAMRQYMHRRRLDGIARLESTRVQVSGWTRNRSTGEEPPSSRVEELDGNDGRFVENGSNLPSNNPSDAPFDAVAYNEPITVNTENDRKIMESAFDEFGTSDPKVVPSLSYLDPFNTYPVALNEADHRLIRHCK